MISFEPPPFRPARLLRGGHLQTLASLKMPEQLFAADEKHVVSLPDGDSIVLHENIAVDGGERRKTLVLFHGLSGCHGSPYMIRLSSRFVDLGWRVYRVDMRGCGAAWELSRQLSHAGRSEDVRAALDFVAGRHPETAIASIGVSLGGNQLLRFAGRVGAGLDSSPSWLGRLARIAVVAPPIDLMRCSDNMERLSRRLYNYYFIRSLFDRIAPGVREREQVQTALQQGRPKTLLQLDDRITAPLSGFDGAHDYYTQCGAVSVVNANAIPTLVLAAKDDPIVPAACFTAAPWPEQTRVVLTATGGHAGFVGRGRKSWMDDCLVAWMNQL